MVRVQQLAELEEVIDYCTMPTGNTATEGRRALIRKMWIDRIQGTKQNVEVWQALLAVRALVLPPTEDIDTWLKFASLCRKSGRISQGHSTLIKLLQYDPELAPPNTRFSAPPQVIFAYLKYQWSLGEDTKRKEAFHRLQDLSVELAEDAHSLGSMYMYPIATSSSVSPSSSGVSLLARIYKKLGIWQWALNPGLDEDSIHDILVAFQKATEIAGEWSKAWHKWALFNTAVMSHYIHRGLPALTSQYVVEAVKGYFRSIAFGANTKGGDDSLQDILRLLTLWFNHGATAQVQVALQEGFSYVNIDTWLVVLPQIIARIHSNIPAVRELIQSLLVRIGGSHPQALMYPLLVACKPISSLHRAAAEEVVDKVRRHSGVLVDQAQLVSKELIRVAILWHELWHEALEEASRLYFGEQNVEGMLNVLEPLHVMLEEGATTLKEVAFIQVLWLKSRTSEIWLDRRTNYTRSLAVMSMVGYLLGLGDRHPSNLMLKRQSGKILHIDFGDCFEASMNREKFPEKVPFRLTRMLVKAMEVSGIEGNFISTCENVMHVLRANKDSVMAMMEAFVHDPLINWRLFNINEVPGMSNLASTHVQAVVNSEESMPARDHHSPLHPQRGAREKELLHLGDANEVLNEQAVIVMARMSNKLTGRDFHVGGEVELGLTVRSQVKKLIAQATSHENLCQNFVGWCPFW